MSLQEAAVIARNPEDYDFARLKAAARACLPHLRRDAFAQVCFGRLLHRIREERLYLEDTEGAADPAPDQKDPDAQFYVWSKHTLDKRQVQIDRYLHLHPLDPDLVRGCAITLDQMGALEEADPRLHPVLINLGCEGVEPRLLRLAAGAATAQLSESPIEEAQAYARGVALGEINLPRGAPRVERIDHVARKATREIRQIRTDTVARMRLLARGQRLSGAWVAPLLTEVDEIRQEVRALAGLPPDEDRRNLQRAGAPALTPAEDEDEATPPADVGPATPWYAPLCQAVLALPEESRVGLGEVIYRLVSGETPAPLVRWLELLWDAGLRQAGVRRQDFDCWVQQLSAPGWEERVRMALPFCELAQVPGWRDHLRCLLTYELPPEVRDWLAGARWRMADRTGVPPPQEGEEDLTELIVALHEAERGLEQTTQLLRRGEVPPHIQRMLLNELMDLDLLACRMLGPDPNS